MKTKIILSLTLFLLLIFAISTLAYASEPKMTISEDYSYLMYEDYKYVRVSKNIDGVSFGGSFDYLEDEYVVFTERQLLDIDDIVVRVYNKTIHLQIYLASGGYEYLYYVREDYLEDYRLVAEGKSPYIELHYQDTVYSRDKFFGETVELDPIDCFVSYSITVINTDDSGDIYYQIGVVIYSGENCYYIDFSENNTTYELFDALDFESIVAHKVTDEEIMSLNNVPTDVEPDRYYVDSSVFLMSVLFLLLPLVLIVFCIFKMKKEKEHYRLLFRIIISISTLLILIALILLFIAIPYL